MKRVEREVCQCIVHPTRAFSDAGETLLNNDLIANENLNIETTVRWARMPVRSQRRQFRIRNDPVILNDVRYAVVVEQLAEIAGSLEFAHGVVGSSTPNV